MKNIILLSLILSLVCAAGCNDDPIVLPCEIAEEHFNNGGAVLADVDGGSFMGESVFHNKSDGRVDLYFSRFSSDQCYTSDLIFIPSAQLKLNDTIFINPFWEINYEMKNGRDSIPVIKIASGNNNWILLREINMDTTELRGDFRLNFIDEGTSPDDQIGQVLFENGQFFSEFKS